MFGISYSIAFIVLATLLPLIPSIIIFVIFPKTEVRATGPLNQLSVRASGAFAAYLILFVAIVAYGAANPPSERNWEIRANLVVRDPSGATVDPRAVDPRLITVSLTPPTFRLRQDRQSTRMVTSAAEIGGRLPVMTVQYGNVGTYVLDFQDRDDSIKVRRDNRRGILSVETPLVIQPVVPPSTGLAAANRAASLP